MSNKELFDTIKLINKLVDELNLYCDNNGHPTDDKYYNLSENIGCLLDTLTMQPRYKYYKAYSICKGRDGKVNAYYGHYYIRFNDW